MINYDKFGRRDMHEDRYGRSALPNRRAKKG